MPAPSPKKLSSRRMVRIVTRQRMPFIAALLVLYAATAIRARSATQPAPQDAPKSSKIAAISVTGAKKFSTDQIVAAGKIKAGDVVTAEQIQAAADRLSALGIFSTVNFRYSARGDAIALEFQVAEAPTYPLSFDNFPWLTDSEIGNAIRADVGLFTGESPGDGAMVDQITAVLEQLLAGRNIKGEVTHQLIAPVTGDGMVMQFRVENSNLQILSLKFGDTLATESERLRDRIPDIKGQPYSRSAIELFESEQVRPLYAAKGFLRAQIGPPVVHLDSDPGNVAGSGVDVLIPVAPGPVYAWKGVTWLGNSVFPSSNLDAAMTIKSGDVADGMKIESAWRTIEDEYARRGYLDVKFTAQPQFDDGSRQISYQVSVIEGPQYRMGELVITGLSVEAEKRLRHYWQIAPGEVFNSGYFDALAKELVKPSTNVFGELLLHYQKFGNWLRPNMDLHTVDVLLDFK